MKKPQLKKFALIGLPGSGKSTFASQLGGILGIPVHHLDRHMFEPGGKKRDKQEFIEIQTAMLAEEAWVVEGCSFSTFEMRFAQADVLIYFHFSRFICFLRLFKRLFNYKRDFGGLRAVTWELLKYTWNFDKEKGARIEGLRQKYPQTEFLIFRGQKDADLFLKSLAYLPNLGGDAVKKASKRGLLLLLGGAILTSLPLYANDDKHSSPTVDLEKSLSSVETMQGAEALIMDQEFNVIKEFYYDASQYDWVEKNYSTDFGKLVIQPPRGVFKPRSEEHLLKFIELANKHEVRLTCRGQGHSTDGQTLCRNSIIIDLRDFPKEFRFTTHSKDALIVSGHATWKELLDFTIQHRLTVPVVTDYLGLSVGGTLSIGGLGGSSFKKGSQADNVLALRVLTFDGQILSCSKTENKEVFRAALCSLGQMGIILHATLSLVESKEHVHCRLFYYRNSELFLKDQHTLYSKGEIDHLKGFIQKKNDELYYVIETAIFYNKPSKDHAEIFEGLSPNKIEERDVFYRDFVNEVTQFTEILSKQNKWDVPHPWYGVLLPEDQVAEHLKKALESPFLTGAEPVLIYPLNTEHLQQQFFIRPHGKTI